MTVNEYLHELLSSLHTQCKGQAPFNTDQLTETDQSFLDKLTSISLQSNVTETHYEIGQQLIGQIIANYPHITPLINRDLLWLLGGDALHYLADDEIALYQQVEDALYEKESREQGNGDFKSVKANLLSLH